MAVGGLNYFGRRKRKRRFEKRKLTVNQQVEVRSTEEGLLGSWHPARVTNCLKRKRRVRYENLLDDHETQNLMDVVDVPASVDGMSSKICNERGFIRPVPPLVKFGEWDLPYGLCVDVSFQDCWWEGVIFDHNDGKEERSVLFPDQGDEMKMRIPDMRITHDWNEVTENWERRGMWVFLELVEEYERHTYSAASIKHIWYETQTKEDFKKIRDWTCKAKELWRIPVSEVVNDYYGRKLEEVLRNPSKCLLTEAPQLESDVHSDPGPSDVFASDIILAKSPMEKGDCSNILETDPKSDSIIPIEEKYDTEPVGDGASNMHIMEDLNLSLDKTEFLVQNEPISPVQEEKPVVPEGISCSGAGTAGTRCYKKNKQQKTRIDSLDWRPLELSGVEFCPDAVNKYAVASKRKIREELKTKVRGHLAYLGWKIELTEYTQFRSLKPQLRYRYFPPDKQGDRVYMSLRKVCEYLKRDNNSESLLSQDDQRIMDLAVDRPISHPAISSPPPPPSVGDVIEPEFCTEAVLRYHLHSIEKDPKADRKNLILKARKHLLAVGWNLVYPTIKGRGMIYKSPKNRCFTSLRVACKAYIEESLPKLISSRIVPPDVLGINEENMNKSDNDKLLLCVSHLLQKEPESHCINDVIASKSTGNRKHKRSRNLNSSLPEIQRKELPYRLLRSRKRVQKVCAACPSHQKPQNVLSWLIDCNVVLPRSKVYYRPIGTFRPKAEGRITHDGIKCSCCKNVYSLGGFANHASGSIKRRPAAAASIILENDKSLLDCQIQLVRDQRTRGTTEKQQKNVYQAENDCICSVCHYGGELILCDQCPSSFHKRCIGLEDIPEGDWFCPSCCCGICRQSKIDGAEDGIFITCIQCEHKYHAKCLSKSFVDKSGRYQENWFCGKSCRKIYAGLHRLLGEPVAVGVNNLSWTLLKYVSPENLGSPNPLMVESYSKLNVALSVMHECFEPLQEVYSGRDLVEDVLFSRWSKLNRLNFQGFYTVLLERNEELISVATIRVYGEKVAEIPLVGTRFQYRRLGMCRILMDELEKRLKELGVERLVLPAVPSVLETWTTSFGFTKMTNSERLQFLDYTFLDFQDTIMCQKLLTSTRPDLVFSTEMQPRTNVLSVSGSTFLGQSIPVSEVQQAEEIDKSGMLDRQIVNDFAGNNECVDNNVDTDQPAKENSEGEQLQDGTRPECIHGNGQLKHVSTCDNNGPYKYYKRRKCLSS